MKGSQILMKSLKNQGIKYIFGIVGREAESILFNEEDIKFILFRDERSAALAADAHNADARYHLGTIAMMQKNYVGEISEYKKGKRKH